MPPAFFIAYYGATKPEGSLTFLCDEYDDYNDLNFENVLSVYF